MENTENNSASDRISYMDLIQMFVAKKKIILLFLIVFLLGGIIIVITTPVEYESSVVTISESDDPGISGLGQLGNLVGMAGINLPNTNRSSFAPDMYPDVIKSRSFLVGLIDEQFFFKSMGKTMTLKDYYVEERPGNALSKTWSFIISSPSLLINLFSASEEASQDEVIKENPAPDDPIRLVSQDEYVIGQLRKRITIENTNRLMTLKVKGPEPLISAQLTNIVLRRLIDYVTEYKTEKQRNNLEFIEERTKEAEQNFKNAQLTLASFRDSNQGIVTQRGRTREEFLQAEFNIAFNVYNTLKQEEEQTRIQLKKETPIFTALEPAFIPLGTAEPKTSFIIIVSIFLGLFVGMGVIVLSIIIDFYKMSSEQYEKNSNG